jgi:predicted transcriptional regulator
MDSEDASYYAEKTPSLEKEQIDFLKLSKEQITVVQSTLRSMNSTLLAVSENEKVLSRGLEEMAKHINERDGEIKDILTATSMLLTINEHTVQLERAINECKREYNILIDAVMNSSQADIPSDFPCHYH